MASPAPLGLKSWLLQDIRDTQAASHNRTAEATTETADATAEAAADGGRTETTAAAKASHPEPAAAETTTAVEAARAGGRHLRRESGNNQRGRAESKNCLHLDASVAHDRLRSRGMFSLPCE